MGNGCQGTGVVLAYENAAMTGDPMPEGLCLEDQLTFQALSLLYARYHIGRISREDAVREKGRLVYEHDRRMRMAAADRELNTWHVDLRKEIEGAQCRYRKERTLEAADALSAVLDGRLNHGK